MHRVAGSNPGGANFLNFFFRNIFPSFFFAKKVLHANRRNMQRKREKTVKIREKRDIVRF